MKEMVGSINKQAAQAIATAIHAHGVELAAQRLKTRRKMFVDNWQMQQDPENPDVWVIQLNAKVRWIDDGQKEHNMLDDLLSSPKAKIAADGSKYLVVPFDHSPGKGKTGATPAQQDLISSIRSELKKIEKNGGKSVPFGKLENDANGKPKLGLLHSLNVGTPLKTANAPGQGHGAIGAPRQGPTGIPFLAGLNVYQSQYQDEQGNTRTKRTFMTFRVASSKHKMQSGRWDHPGTQPANIVDDTYKWAMDQWSNEIEPALRQVVLARIG